jgi:hypothetical protein
MSIRMVHIPFVVVHCGGSEVVPIEPFERDLGL